jgi:hypothetical protein
LDRHHSGQQQRHYHHVNQLQHTLHGWWPQKAKPSSSICAPAGFITGNPADVGVNALPVNAWGGRVGVTNAAVQGRPAARLLVCLGSVPGKAAAALDVQLDDGRV